MPDLHGVKPPAHLTEKGREAWRRRQELEQQRLAKLTERKQEFESARRDWERLCEQYCDNPPVLKVLEGHEPQLDEGGGWTIRMPVVFCDACGVKDDTGAWWGLWPCWTYEALADHAREPAAAAGRRTEV